MSQERLHKQIEIFLNDKLGSKMYKSCVKKTSNVSISQRYVCVKTLSCKCACNVIFHYEKKIATIYWNELEHDHHL